jgi:hypothetical protein
MDPFTVAATAFSFLTPYLIEGGKELSKGVFKDLWTGVKDLFKSDEEKEVLTKFKDNPKDAKTQRDAQYLLEKKLENSEQSLKELSELVEKIKIEQKNESKNIIKSKGKGNINLQGINVGRDFKMPSKKTNDEK